MKREVLVVFLASPSDLAEERKVVREVVDRVNRIFSRETGWTIDLRGWEDTLPGFKRPQDLINRDVDEAVLFIGVLGTRWGTKTGKYTSGFAEEFERAKSRQLANQTPEIWLFFKALDQERLKDPGPQLEQVLAFKQQQIELNELMFKEFAHLSEFRDVVQDCLTTYLLRLSTSPEASTGPSSSTTAKSELAQNADAANSADPQADGDGKQLAELLTKAAKLVRNASGPLDLSLVERTRLLIASSTWFSEQHENPLLGIHPLHIAFRERRVWELTSREEWLLFRTMLSDTIVRRPGWYWQTAYPVEELRIVIWHRAVNDGNSDVKKGALEHCAVLSIPSTRAGLESLAKDDDEDVVLATIRLIQKSKLSGAIDLVEKLSTDKRSRVRDAASEAYLDLLFQNDQLEAIRQFVARGGKPVSWLSKTSGGVTTEIDDVFLKHCLAQPDNSIRTFAAERLRTKGSLDKASWEKLLEDTEQSVRVVAVEALIDLGSQFDWGRLTQLFPPRPSSLFALFIEQKIDKNALRRRQLKRLSIPQLQATLDFYHPDGPLSYELIGESAFPILEGRIRQDLNSDFEKFRVESLAKVRASLGDAAQTILSKITDEMVESIRHELIAFALTLLARIAKADDAQIARKFLHRKRYPDVVLAAVELLRQCGNNADSDAILAIRRDFYGNAKVKVVKAAIAVSNDKLSLLNRLVSEDDVADYASTIASEALLHSTSVAQAFSKQMIRSKFDAVRRQGIEVLAKTNSKLGLEEELEKYLTESPYYYDVVTWLDQLVYAPPEFEVKFRAALLGDGYTPQPLKRRRRLKRTLEINSR